MNRKYSIEYMKVRSFISLLAITALLLAGCSVDELFNPDPTNDKFIRFSTRLPATRAAAYQETGANAYNSMMVYAILNDVSIDLMPGQVVKRQAGSDGWHYSPSVEWQAGSEVSFYAYAPHDAITLTRYEGDPPVLEDFTVPPTTGGKAANQIDLLMAESVTGSSESFTGAVQLTMRHVLTRVCFSARTQHPNATDVASIKISSVKLTGLQNRGTHDVDATLYWTPLATDAATNTYELTSAGGGLRNVTLSNSVMENLTTDDGNLYLMPQVLTDAAAKLTITVETTGTNASVTTKDYQFSLIDLLDELKQGESLRFLLTVPNAASPELFGIKVVHSDWNAEYNIDAAIERDPVLYISNETVHAYDGAVTCVYFSSNIPPNADGSYNDIVYIEDQGRVGSNTGATFVVKDEFYAIAQSDPDRNNITLDYNKDHLNNLRYETGEGGLYKGHLDIVQCKTTAAGETPNEGKQPLILKLHVGKLVRDITVQRVVTTEAAKQNPTRYVGTFHRHHETGERLVTWHEDEDTRWRVEIDNLREDDQAELQLDTRISPDFRNKQLYSLVARDPEGTRVEQNNNLFGRGRVYFRVGWKTPTDGVTNRNVRIKVSLWKGGKIPTYDAGGKATGADEVHYLYCRQGETEEKIATADSRYALYNVLTPGQFVRYPTQTGMLYQWNRLVPWSPLGEAPPYGWNSNTNDYETSFDYQRSACPDGYVYPSSLQKSEMQTVFGDGTVGAGTPSARGYYADGYFDRRAITYNGAQPTKNEHRVNASNVEVAAIGTLIFNNGLLGYDAGKARSIFLVSGGLREADGTLLAYEIDGHDDHGVHGGYWFDLEESAGSSNATGAWIYKNTTKDDIKSYPKRNAHSIRCISTDSWLFLFNANGGENGPRNMTIPAKETTVKIPNVIPNNYYRDSYEFKGWSRNPAGAVDYLPGQTVNTSVFGSAAQPANRIMLYAQWSPLNYNIVDFKSIPGMDASKYLYSKPTIQYEVLNPALSTANGTGFAIASTLLDLESYFNPTHKVYPYLEFTNKEDALNLQPARDACNNLAPKGAWRLPRVQEYALLYIYESVNQKQVNSLMGINTSGTALWTGTNNGANTLYSTRSINNYFLSAPNNSNIGYRCVRMKISDADYHATTFAGLGATLTSATNNTELFVKESLKAGVSLNVSASSFTSLAYGEKVYVRFEGNENGATYGNGWTQHNYNPAIAIFTKWDAYNIAGLKSLLEGTSVNTGDTYYIGMSGTGAGSNLSTITPNLAAEGNKVTVKFTTAITGALSNGWVIDGTDNTKAVYTKLTKYTLAEVKSILEGSGPHKATYYVNENGGDRSADIDQILPAFAAIGNTVRLEFNTSLTKATNLGANSAWQLNGGAAVFTMPTLITDGGIASTVNTVSPGGVIYYDNTTINLSTLTPAAAINPLNTFYLVVKDPSKVTTASGWTINGRVLKYVRPYDFLKNQYSTMVSVLNSSATVGKLYYIEFEGDRNKDSYAGDYSSVRPNIPTGTSIYLWHISPLTMVEGEGWTIDGTPGVSHIAKYTKP